MENISCLRGIVDIYPALNPLGIDSISRGVPMFDLDMNRIFPRETPEGPMMETVVGQLMDDIAGADMCIDIHASNIFLEEMPQVRINEETAQTLVPFADLAYSLNSTGVPTLVVEMGVGMRITKQYGYQLVEGILNLMKQMGIWDGPVVEVRKPIISSDGKVGFVNADCPGIYLPEARIFDKVKKGNVIGKVVNPLTGDIVQEVTAPIDGMVFTRREYPIVYSGSLLNRILGGY
ncbi:MAG: succinylglutamate desuccinylase/aspartoacylase family protein [Lachnoclostridium sp.]